MSPVSLASLLMMQWWYFANSVVAVEQLVDVGELVVVAALELVVEELGIERFVAACVP